MAGSAKSSGRRKSSRIANREKIAAEEELDGLYIVRSNVEPELFDADHTVASRSSRGPA